MDQSELIIYTAADFLSGKYPREISPEKIELDNIFKSRRRTMPNVYIILAYEPSGDISIYPNKARFAKIGHAINPIQRKNDLQVGCPLWLEIWGICHGGKDLEDKLHKYLKEDHSSGEWFRNSRQVQLIVQMMPEDNPSLFAR